MAGGKKSSRGASGGNLILRKTLSSVGLDPSSYHSFRGVGRPSSSSSSSIYPRIIIPNPKRLRAADKLAVTTVREVQALVHSEHFVRPKPAVQNVATHVDKRAGGGGGGGVGGGAAAAEQQQQQQQQAAAAAAVADATAIFGKCLDGVRETSRGRFFPDELVTGQKGGVGGGLKRGAPASGGGGSRAEQALQRLRNLHSREVESLKNGGLKGVEEEDEDEEAAEEEPEDQDVDADYTKDYYRSDDDDDDGGGDDDEGGTF